MENKTNTYGAPKKKTLTGDERAAAEKRWAREDAANTRHAAEEARLYSQVARKGR